jgi:DNA-binding Xre family transcriptional regulator
MNNNTKHHNTKVRTLEDRLREDLEDPETRQYFNEYKLAAELAIQLVTLREKRKLTQTELADLMGTTQQTISRLESGEYEGFTLKTLAAIARATNADLEIHFKPKSFKRLVFDNTLRDRDR